MKKVLFTLGLLIFSIVMGCFSPSVATIQPALTVNMELLTSEKPTSITKFDKPFTVVTVEDNVLLKAFPSDYGFEDLQYYNKGITLDVVGEYDGFYQVQLARDDYAWIDKSIVQVVEGYDNSPAVIESFVYEELPNERIYTIKLNKKVPYLLSESILYRTEHFIKYSDGLDLVVYNVKNYPENKYEVHLNKLGVNDFGYKIYYKNNNELIIKMKNFPKVDPQKPLEGLKITLSMSNIKYPYKKCPCLISVEDEVSSKILNKLKILLEDFGAKVSLVDDDSDSTIPDTDIFITLHNDLRPVSLNAVDPVGVNVFYYYPQSSTLASKIEDSISYHTGLKDRGVDVKNFELIKKTDYPAVFVELSYLINSAQHYKIVDDEFQKSVAKGILKGIVRYLNDK